MIALCVGHSRQGDSGAASVDGTTEWDYNSDLAERISCMTQQEIRIYNPTEERGIPGNEMAG